MQEKRVNVTMGAGGAAQPVSNQHVEASLRAINHVQRHVAAEKLRKSPFARPKMDLHGLRRLPGCSADTVIDARGASSRLAAMAARTNFIKISGGR